MGSLHPPDARYHSSRLTSPALSHSVPDSPHTAPSVLGNSDIGSIEGSPVMERARPAGAAVSHQTSRAYMGSGTGMNQAWGRSM